MGVPEQEEAAEQSLRGAAPLSEEEELMSQWTMEEELYAGQHSFVQPQTPSRRSGATSLIALLACLAILVTGLRAVWPIVEKTLKDWGVASSTKDLDLTAMAV